MYCRSCAYVPRRSTAPPMTAPPPAWGWVDTPSTILRNPLFARGGVRVKRGSCPAAGAGGQPLHRYIIHRMRKPSRSGTRGRRPGVAQPGEGQPLLPSGPAASSSARSPPTSSMPATGPAVPAIQPSMVVLTTADPPTSKLGPPPPPLFPLPKNHQSESKAVFLSPQGSPRPLNPHPTPPRRPSRWLTPPPTTCR